MIKRKYKPSIRGKNHSKAVNFPQFIILTVFLFFFCISRIMFKKSNSTREMTKNKQKENTKRQINQKAKGNKQKLRHDNKKKDKKG